MNRLPWIVLVALVLALLRATAWASPLDCEDVRDPDARHYCRALAKGSKAECSLIKDEQLRSLCRAKVGACSCSPGDPLCSCL